MRCCVAVAGCARLAISLLFVLGWAGCVGNEDDRPPDPDCSCYTCRTCSRAYLRHLFQAGEINASTLNTLHNLHFYLDTLRRIRESVEFRRFESFRVGFHQSLSRQPHH